ncbi:permease [Brachyspira murdochii]|uniref:Permease n=1 Tax=Brachyspira murdochii (strain ATCC 51284 / DSM 12563 / 56-150) TaxID=526224 RepID=D5U3P2_BRAM5|nr:permease [Brachyspira murdochii]ADG72124.1 permease [Brachyspira murdochii DSM 12563]
MLVIKSIFVFIQDQIISMKWLNTLIGNILNNFALSETMKGVIQFFIYDVIKIFVLLSVLIFCISYIQSYFPPERTKKILSRFNGISANILAALFGTVTPFCSCSSIPLFIGFTSAGIPISMTFSFLISSPLVDLASLILLSSVFGMKIAIAYVIVGLVLAVVGGTLIGKLKMERYLEDFVKNIKSNADVEIQTMTKKDRIIYSKNQVMQTIKKVYLYIFIGVGIGAFIHNVIPEAWINTVLGKNNWYSVPLATLVGIPMYADIFGTLPVAESLFYKGAGIGTILSFMMAVTALSLPSIIMIKKVVKIQLLVLFVGIVTLGIIIIGYLFNNFYFLFV